MLVIYYVVFMPRRGIDMSKFINDIKKYKKYMFYSAKSGLKSEVAGSRLGWIWWVLEPVLFMLVYWFIFAVIFGNSTQYFPIYVFIGISMWNFINKTVLDSVKIVNTNKGIVSKVYLPKYTLIMVEMLMNAFKLAISFAIVIFMMIIYKVGITLNVLWLIPIFLTMVLVTFGASCLFAHFGVFVEDLKTLMNVVTRIVFYMSGVFYELVPMNPAQESKLPDALALVLTKCNPVAFLMISVRKCLIYSMNIDYWYLLGWFIIGAILSMLGVRTIYKYENSYVKVM